MKVEMSSVLLATVVFLGSFQATLLIDATGPSLSGEATSPIEFLENIVASALEARQGPRSIETGDVQEPGTQVVTLSKKILKSRLRRPKVEITTKITTTVTLPKRRTRRIRKHRVSVVSKTCRSSQNLAPELVAPTLLQSLLGEIPQERGDRIFSDRYENAHEFGPFATVIKELLLEAKEAARERYYEGSIADEDSYHVKTLAPTQVIFRDEEGDGLHLEEEGSAASNPMLPLIQSIIKSITGSRNNQGLGKGFNIV
jgi:hypothetical protein